LINARVFTMPLTDIYSTGSPNFLTEGHISYFTTVRGPDILRCFGICYILPNQSFS